LVRFFTARKSGLVVPRDISIAGIDNIPFSRYVYPPITTVDLKGPEQARIAVRKLIDTLQGIARPSHTIVEPGLVIRESCAPPG
jgi:LacI family transcriptional regulator